MRNEMLNDPSVRLWKLVLLPRANSRLQTSSMRRWCVLLIAGGGALVPSPRGRTHTALRSERLAREEILRQRRARRAERIGDGAPDAAVVRVRTTIMPPLCGVTTSCLIRA